MYIFKREDEKNCNKCCSRFCYSFWENSKGWKDKWSKGWPTAVVSWVSEERPRGWRDGSAVRDPPCSCRGPEFWLLYPQLVAHKYPRSSSREPMALGSKHTYTNVACRNTCTRTHNLKIKTGTCCEGSRFLEKKIMEVPKISVVIFIYFPCLLHENDTK